MDPFTVSIAAFVGVTGLVIAAIFLFGEMSSSSVEDRLEVLAGKKPVAGADTRITRDLVMKEGFQGLHGLLKSFTARFENMKFIFVQAESPISPEAFIGVVVGVGVVGGVIGGLLGVPSLVLPLCAMGTMVLPVVWLLWRRKRRFKKFASQLPEAMSLIARALRSGHSLASGLKVVVDELNDPMAKEFNIAYEEQNLGIPLEQTLRNMFRRIPNMDLKFFTTAVAIQKQAGGDLAEILDKIAYIVRERFKIQGQVQALTGEGRISGIVLMALPILLFFAVWRLNPSYVMLLFTDELGRKMVGVAIFLQILGAFTIQKIIQIKV